MKAVIRIFILFIIIFNISLNTYSQSIDNFFLFNSFEYLNLDNIFSFRYLYDFGKSNIFSVNFVNSFIFTYYLSLDDDGDKILFELPFFYKLKNYPLLFKFSISNYFVSTGYIVRFFNIIENSLNIYYPFNNNFYSFQSYTYELSIAINFSNKFKFFSTLALNNNIFDSTISLSNLFNDFDNYLGYKVGFDLSLYNINLLFLYYSQDLASLYIRFLKKYDIFSLFFLLNLKEDNYSFGFEISKAKKYSEVYEKNSLYIIDFNEVKPDANLFIKLRKNSKLSNNIYLFKTGKYLKDINDLEDLSTLIKSLQKNNLCFVYIDEIDLYNLAFASNFNTIFANKFSKTYISKGKVEKSILDKIIENYLFMFYGSKNFEEKDIMFEIIRRKISSNKNLDNYFQQVIEYLIDIIASNKEVEKEELTNYIFSNNFIDMNQISSLKFIDYFIAPEEIIDKIKNILSRSKIKVGKIENLFFDINKESSNLFANGKKIAIVYLKEYIGFESAEKTNNFEVLSFSSFQKSMKILEKENYSAILFIFDSTFCYIEEAEKILFMLNELKRKKPVYIYFNSNISFGSVYAGLLKNNIFIHQNSIVIPEIYNEFYSICQIIKNLKYNYGIYNNKNKFLFVSNDKEYDDRLNLYLENLMNINREKIIEIIQKQRGIGKKDIYKMFEKEFLSGLDCVGFNLVDYIIDFDNLITKIIKDLDLNENMVDFEIIYLNKFYEKITFWDLITNIYNMIDNFIKQ